MLKPCPECGREVSEQAASCPHCGHPLAQPAQGAKKPKKGAPIFVVLTLLTFVLLLLTPRLLLIVPLIGTLAFAAIALLRREAGSALAAIVGLLAVAAYVLGGATLQRELAAIDPPGSKGGTASAYEDSRSKNAAAALAQAEVVKFTWVKDRDFGTKGAIKWNVQVKNNGQAYMRDAKVEFTTYDKQGSLVSTTFTYVKAIPPGGTRAESSFADLYGNEARASAKVVSVTLE